MPDLTLTFLGSGTSHGIPMIGCNCPVCLSQDPRDKRLRASIHVAWEGFSAVVDTGPDFRSQCLRARIASLDAVLYTHSHTDHVMGFDDLRRFCEARGGSIPIYASPSTMTDLERIYHFAFNGENHYPGYTRPDPRLITGPFELLGGVRVTPVELPHGKSISVGYLFERHGRKIVAYLTDCHAVPEAAVTQLRGVEVVIIDALREKGHASHLTFAMALEAIEAIGPHRALFTHICHEASHAAIEARLPSHVRVAYDGLVLEL